MPEATLENRIANRLIAGLDHAHRIIRELSRGLIAIEVDTKGLAAALKELAKWTTEHSSIPVNVECPESIEMPDHTTATHVFRIAQEAVSNALRHGQSRQINLSLLCQPSGLCLKIKDDGIGLHLKAEESQGLGLRIMKYRAGLLGGILQIGPVEEGGTIVTLTLPERTSDDSNSTEIQIDPIEYPDRG
jgi:signal transduction histidine kinase